MESGPLLTNNELGIIIIVSILWACGWCWFFEPISSEPKSIWKEILIIILAGPLIWIFAISALLTYCVYRLCQVITPTFKFPKIIISERWYEFTLRLSRWRHAKFHKIYNWLIKGEYH